MLEPRGQGHSDARAGFINAVRHGPERGLRPRVSDVAGVCRGWRSIGLAPDVRGSDLDAPPAWERRLIPPGSRPKRFSEIQVMLRDALEERYLAYALSTIMHRALPDARDGLKPVHRRILYGMRLLRLDPGTAFKKSAKSSAT